MNLTGFFLTLIVGACFVVAVLGSLIVWLICEVGELIRRLRQPKTLPPAGPAERP